MKNTIKILFVFSCIALLCSCSSVSRRPDYGIYGIGAIQLRIKSDQDLNYYNGEPHTLRLCVYQLSSLNAFNQLREEKDGFSKLLECSSFDSSVTSSKPFVIYPGQDLNEVIDRAEGTKYIAFIAGYYKMQKDESIRNYQIPVGYFSKKPKKVQIDLYLGQDKIRGFEGK